MLCGTGVVGAGVSAQAARAEPAARPPRSSSSAAASFTAGPISPQHMAPLPVTNRAVDGLHDDRSAAPLRRRRDDDPAARARLLLRQQRRGCGRSGRADCRPHQAIRRARGAALPATRVVFMSVNRAPEKRALWDVVDAVNRGVQTYAEATKRLQYVEVNPVLFNADGSPRMELYHAGRTPLPSAGLRRVREDPQAGADESIRGALNEQRT